MRYLSIIVLLAACGPVVPALETKGVQNAVDAAKMTDKVNKAISATALPAAARDTTAPTFTRDCTKGGTKTGTVKGKLVGSTTGSDGNPVSTYELEFSGCKTDTAELYGIVTWSYSTSTLGSGSAQYKIKLSGTLGVKLDGGALQGNVTYKDLIVTANVSQTGTTNNTEITVTGSLDIGGKVYTLTQEDFREVFVVPQ